MSLQVMTYGNPDADTLLFQMVDDHDLEVIESEVAYIRELTGGQDFCLKAVKVDSWNQDLSPWSAPAVFGDEDFGDGAAGTLQFLLKEVLPKQEVPKQDVPKQEVLKQEVLKQAVRDHTLSDQTAPDRTAPDWTAPDQTAPDRTAPDHTVPDQTAPDQTVPDHAADTQKVIRMYIGGYSLAGLFALWAGYQTGRFDGIAAASPSVWFPRFTEYIREHTIHADRVYLSLGDREERTRNPVMAQVGKAIREAEAILKAAGRDCVLEWNKGNHFKDADLRTAKGFAWLMNQGCETALK